MTSTQTDAPCPVCAGRTRGVHRRDERIVADRPWGTARVRWPRRGRKCVGGHVQCPRRIFTARLPGVVAPWARRPPRLVAWLIASGLTLGGTAGVRLRPRVGRTVSRQTLRRGVRRRPLPGDRTPPVIGVDDVAFRNHQPDGTGLMDVERRQPVAWWPEREAET